MFTMKTLLVVAFAAVINETLAQSFNFGACPEVTTVENLDLEKYSGLWYEYQRSFPMYFKFGGKCVTANYTLNDDETIKVVNKQISEITGSESSMISPARVNYEACNNTTCGKLKVTFPLPVIGNVDVDYWVLGTDYTTYSVVWSCNNFKAFHTSYAWIFTRDQNPSEDVVKQARSLFESKKPENIFMTTTDQKNCL